MVTKPTDEGTQKIRTPDGDFRRRAEARVKTARTDASRMEAAEIQALLHELEVHQIELELQNEELRAGQLELARTRDRYLELYEFAPVGYLTLDARGVIRESNLRAAGILGIDRGRLVGRPFVSLVAPEDGDACHLYLQRAQTSDTFVATELRLRHPDASFWARLETRAARKGEEESWEYRVAFSDVTVRREAEERLKALNDTLDHRVAQRTAEAQARSAELQRLAAQLSRAEERERRRIALLLHDGLQQDLVALRYRLDTLALGPCKGTPDEETIHELGAAIEECLARARELSYDLSPPVLQNGFLPALEWLSQDVGLRYGLNVTLNARPDAEPVKPAIAAVLFRSVKELLLNIRKHSGASSAEITVHRTAKGIQVTVADKGRGFDTAALKKGKSTPRGFGLLSIEERLRFTGGDIDIQSLPGVGCRVVLDVPDQGDGGTATAVPPSGVEAVSGTSAAAGRQEPRAPPVQPAVIRILLVDDHALTRQGIAALIAREKDLKVIAQAANGQEAVRLASELRPDVVIMDVSMPNMDGFEATSRIKELLPAIRIIGLSMYDDPLTAEKMRRSGAEAYLCKTGSPARLVEAVRAPRH